jgi:hypothetical protein
LEKYGRRYVFPESAGRDWEKSGKGSVKILVLLAEAWTRDLQSIKLQCYTDNRDFLSKVKSTGNMNERLSNSVRVCSCVLIQQCDRWEESAKHLRY